MSIAGSSSIRRLNDVAIVMDLHELAPVDGRATSGRHRWRLERFAKCVRIFRIGPGSVMNAISRMSPPQFGHSSGNSSPTRAISLAQAIREVSWERGF